MPHFDIITNEDGSVAQIVRDGTVHHESVTLEPANQIVSTYFKMAAGNLAGMKDADGELRRHRGLQAFLTSLTGVEAFTNIFFQQLALERNHPELLTVVSKQSGPLVKRIEKCLTVAFADPIPAQDALMQRIGRLYGLRNNIVHPRWEPTSICLVGDVSIAISGLAQNFQVVFENEEFCRETFWWCVKLVAEVGRAAGNTVIESHCFHWTGIYGLTDERLSEYLSLAESY
ncbi:MAG: hypothetical protein RLZZ444_768 [Pseudomonadota bacterium]|jgi:hypothetical protein